MLQETPEREGPSETGHAHCDGKPKGNRNPGNGLDQPLRPSPAKIPHEIPHRCPSAPVQATNRFLLSSTVRIEFYPACQPCTESATEPSIVIFENDRVTHFLLSFVLSSKFNKSPVAFSAVFGEIHLFPYLYLAFEQIHHYYSVADAAVSLRLMRDDAGALCR